MNFPFGGSIFSGGDVLLLLVGGLIIFGGAILSLCLIFTNIRSSLKTKNNSALRSSVLPPLIFIFLTWFFKLNSLGQGESLILITIVPIVFIVEMRVRRRLKKSPKKIVS